MRWLRFVQILLVAAAAAGTIAAQLRTTLGDQGGPFNIKQGTTFSASGGSVNGASLESERIRERIRLEITEAQNVIRRYYVDAPAAANDAGHTANTVDGMLRALDPHSHFYDKGRWTELLGEQRSSYTGIGATIADYQQSGVTNTFVLSTFPGSPAERSGLRFGDRIVAIDGRKMSSKTSDLVRDEIRGPNGTTFRLTLKRAATGRLENILMRRNRVPTPSIPDAYLLKPGVGYIDLTEGFTYTTADEFAAAMNELKRSGMTSLVLDLRGNGGGIVEQAVKVAERFLGLGTLILTQRGRTAMDNRIWRSGNAAPESMPLILLVNEETASASEIVAGALQDNDRAIVVGQKTFGKGLVQTVVDLPAGTGVTLTTGRYLTPSGRSIQRYYANGDLYDYFKHATPAAAVGQPFFEARTITDRRVFGGDGIQPDETAKQPEITAHQAALLDPIFFFVRKVAGGQVRGLERSRPGTPSFGRRVGAADMEVSEDLMARFREYALNEWSGRISEDKLSRDAAFIGLRLRYGLVMASFGAVSANQVLTDKDTQVQTALAALPRAAQLFQLAQRQRRQRP